MFDDIPPTGDDQSTPSHTPDPVDEPVSVGSGPESSGRDDDTSQPTSDTPSDSPSDPYSSETTPEPGTSSTDTIAAFLSDHDIGDLDEHDEELQVELPDELPILPLKDTVVYPSAVSPLGVGKERSIQLIDEVMRGSSLLVRLHGLFAYCAYRMELFRSLYRAWNASS